MVDRNRKLKLKPEKFQDSDAYFRIIFTVEERIFDRAMEHFMSKSTSNSERSAHVINLEVEDNLQSAARGARLICELARNIHQLEDIDSEIEEYLESYQQKHGISILHSLVFY